MKSARVKSASQFVFSRSPQANIPRSSFNRSYDLKTTFDAGYLIPVYWDEALPGDSFNLKMHAFARMATPIYPIFDNLYLESFFFAVPYRLLWSNWEKFNGAQTNPGDSTTFLCPTAAAPVGGYAELSLQDYFGIPTKIAGLVHNQFHLRAYNLVYNTWFRSQDLQNSVVVDTGDGPDTVTNYVLLRRGKRHDYFTSCLPFAQKGTAVDIPLGGNAPVISNDSDVKLYNSGSGGARTVNFGSSLTYSGAPTTGAVRFSGTDTGLIADLSGAAAATINSLRQSFQIQRMLERDARGGTRYPEVIKAHFGVTSDDARQQRPEYLGGGHSNVIVHPVAQTAATAGANALGDLGAFATLVASGHGFTKSFTEHCVLIGLVSVRADLTYQQGLDRMWSRQTRYDFYWPALSHIGEQAVLNKEIYARNDANDVLTFGFQERWAEYRFKNSVITGRMRSNATVPLDAWHLAQNFVSLPVLNAAFIVENPPMSRIEAVADEPDFLFDAHFTINAARPMPTYSVPGLIDHF